MASTNLGSRSASCQLRTAPYATLEFIQGGELQAADCPARDLPATMRRLVTSGADILAVSHTSEDGIFLIVPLGAV